MTVVVISAAAIAVFVVNEIRMRRRHLRAIEAMRAEQRPNKTVGLRP